MRIRTGVIASFFLIAALLVAAPAYAQNKIGVIGGANLTNISFDPSASQALGDQGFDSGDSRGKAGFGVGILFERPITPKINLRLHGLFNQVGFGLEGAVSEDIVATASGLPRVNGTFNFSFENDITLNEFNIDALVNFPVGAAARVAINAGLFFSFVMSQSETFREDFDGDIDEGTVDEEDETDVRGNDVGIGIGGEFKVTPKIIIGALYRLGLVNRDESADEEAIFNSAKTRAIFIYVAFLFKGVN